MCTLIDIHMCRSNHQSFNILLKLLSFLAVWQREGGYSGSLFGLCRVLVGGAALNSLPYVVADDLLTFG